MGFLFLFLLGNLIVSAQACNKNLTILTYLDTFAGDNLYKISNHPFPDFREDDTLYINKIEIKNWALCNSSVYSLRFSIEKPTSETLSDAFCSYNSFTVPNLKFNGSYIISFSKVIDHSTENGFITQDLLYIDSQNNNFTLCKQKLTEINKWKINVELTPQQSGINYVYFVDKNNIGKDGYFKVYSKIDMDVLDLASITENLTETLKRLTNWILIVAVITLCFQLYSKEIKKWLSKTFNNKIPPKNHK